MHAPHLSHVGLAVGVVVAVREGRRHGPLNSEPGELEREAFGFAGLRSDRGLGALGGVEPYDWDDVLAALLAAQRDTAPD